MKVLSKWETAGVSLALVLLIGGVVVSIGLALQSQAATPPSFRMHRVYVTWVGLDTVPRDRLPNATAMSAVLLNKDLDIGGGSSGNIAGSNGGNIANSGNTNTGNTNANTNTNTNTNDTSFTRWLRPEANVLRGSHVPALRMETVLEFRVTNPTPFAVRVRGGRMQTMLVVPRAGYNESVCVTPRCIQRSLDEYIHSFDSGNGDGNENSNSNSDSTTTSATSTTATTHRDRVVDYVMAQSLHNATFPYLLLPLGDSPLPNITLAPSAHDQPLFARLNSSIPLSSDFSHVLRKGLSFMKQRCEKSSDSGNGNSNGENTTTSTTPTTPTSQSIPVYSLMRGFTVEVGGLRIALPADAVISEIRMTPCSEFDFYLKEADLLARNAP